MIFVAALGLVLSAVEPVRPRSEVVEAFVAAIQKTDKSPARRPADEREALRLKELNPEKSQDIEAAFGAFEQCRRTTQERAGRLAAQKVADHLSDSDLTKLLTYLGTGDDKRLAALQDKEMFGEEKLSPQEVLEQKRITRSYPVKKLDNLMLSVALPEFGSADAQSSFASCDQNRSQALKRSGIRTD